MNRTTWLQDRRMEKFCDVLSRWKARELSAQEAGEILGCSERQFRRYRRRYEEEGLQGLFERRLPLMRNASSRLIDLISTPPKRRHVRIYLLRLCDHSCEPSSRAVGL